MGLQIVTTGDNSSSLYNDELQEKYHSYDGAWTESMYVYIEQGVRFAAKTFGKTLSVFEFGFGTGLNAFQTALVAKNEEYQIDFTTVEKYPVPELIYTQLNYIDFTDSNKDWFLNLHTLSWNEKHALSPYFIFKKIHNDFLNIAGEKEKYHVIYFDAFAPNKQPEVWDSIVFERLYQSLVPGGNLVTYCAQGEFKRKLKAAGFKVEKLPGPPGKREMTRALKSED